MRADPITFEVIRHRLAQINEEQGITIRATATSPIVVEGNDFNVGIFTRDGELTIAGPYTPSHLTTMDAVIRNVITLADEINDGDMFMVNDPYLGALHQSDLAVVSPLYFGGELVMWVGNVLHHADIGGIDEGSFCVNATNVHQEPPRYFLKLVERGRFCHEVERTFTTNSRLPNVVALDLRAQVSALNVVKARLTELLQERGVELVTEVMDRSLDYAEEQLRKLISELPDGHWQTEIFMDGDRVGSSQIFRVVLKLEKSGSELFFDYSGSDRQSVGAVNATGYACYGGTTAPLYGLLCRNQIDWNGALRRCVKVHAPEGTVMNASYPAAVSICSIGFTWLATVAAQKVVSQMLSASEKYRERLCPSWNSSCNANNLFGIDAQGRQVGALLSDHRGSGAGARSFADGFDHAGVAFSCFSLMANVESQEWKLPVLYLYRRELPDSGGPGKYRGGLTSVSALTPFRTNALLWKSQNTGGVEMSNAVGIDGGYPGAGSQVSVVRSSRVWEQLKNGHIPLTYEELGGTVEHCPSKSDGTLKTGDCFIFYASGGGGYGDPLLRDPEAVRNDVASGAVSAQEALRAYGVVLAKNLRPNKTATLSTRAKLREQRLKSAKPPVAHGTASQAVEAAQCNALAESLQRVSINGSHLLGCRACQYIFCRADEDLQEYVAQREVPLAHAGPWLAINWNGESPRFTLMESLCPRCGVLLEVEQKLKVNKA